MFVDTHIHLTHKLYEGSVPCLNTSDGVSDIEYYDRKALIGAMQNKKIGFAVEPGIDFASNEKIYSFATQYPKFVYPAVGIHPTRVSTVKWSQRKEIEVMASRPGVVAVGELGLDYHLDRLKQYRIKQYMWFVWQLLLADRLKKPLILHIRQADMSAIRILKIFKKRIHGGVVHCFNGDVEIARIYTEELGLKLGIGGSLLHKECSNLEEVVQTIPLENLVLETDGPFVKPERNPSMSGKQWKKARNSSLIIPMVAKRIADIKAMNLEKVEKVTTENAIKLFGIDV